MKQVLLFSVLLSIAACSFGQTPSTIGFVAEWSSGEVVFATGDTIRCDMRYNHALPAGLLQLRENDLLITVPPEDVSSFSFYDQRRARVRRFICLDLKNENEQPVRSFLEMLYSDGKISILRHRTIGLPRDHMSYTWFFSKPARVNRHYLFDHSRKHLVPMSRDNAFQMLGGIDREMNRFIDARNLRFKSVGDYVTLFKYHESL